MTVVPVSGVYSLKFRALFELGAGSNASVHLKLRIGPDVNALSPFNSSGSWIITQENNETDFDGTGSLFTTLFFLSDLYMKAGTPLEPDTFLVHP